MEEDFSALVNRTFSSSPRLSLHPLAARPSLLDLPKRHTDPTVPGESAKSKTTKKSPQSSSHSHTESEPKSSTSTIASTMTSMTSTSSRRLSFEPIAPPLLQPNPLSSHPVSSAPSSARPSPKPSPIPSFPTPPTSAKTLPILPTSRFSPATSPRPSTPQLYQTRTASPAPLPQPQTRPPAPPQPESKPHPPQPLSKPPPHPQSKPPPQPQSKPPPPPPPASTKQQPPQPQPQPQQQQQQQQQQSRPSSQPFVHSIHRNFDAYTSPRFQACENLSGSLGYSVRAEINWSSLLSNLGTFYQQDISLLPLDVARVVEAFAHALGNLVDDATGATDDGWNSRFFEAIRPVGVVKIFVNVRDPVALSGVGAGEGNNSSSGSGARAGKGIGVDFSTDKQGFVVWVPKKAIGQTVEALTPLLTGEICAIFWIGGCEDSGVADGLDYLPSPDDLFTRGPQYLIVRDEVGEVVIEGSHSESLELLASWFQKWTRINEGDSLKRPHFEVEMHYSSWGHGERKRLERLALRRTHKLFHASVTSVLVVVEGVAGYSRINIQGNSYVFEKQC